MESINHFTRLTAALFRADHSGSGNSCHLAYPDEEKELKDKKRQKQKKEGCFPRRMNWYRLMRSGRASS